MSFDLDKIVRKKLGNSMLRAAPIPTTGGAAQHTLSSADILKRYEEIPRAEWSTLPLGIYIRYKSRDGKLKVGGRLTKLTPAGDELILSISRSGKKHIRWSVNTRDIINLYKFKEQPVEQPTPETNAAVKEPPVSPAPLTAQQSTMIALGDKLLFTDPKDLAKRLDAVERQLADVIHRMGQLYKILNVNMQKNLQ